MGAPCLPKVGATVLAVRFETIPRLAAARAVGVWTPRLAKVELSSDAAIVADALAPGLLTHHRAVLHLSCLVREPPRTRFYLQSRHNRIKRAFCPVWALQAVGSWSGLVGTEEPTHTAAVKQRFGPSAECRRSPWAFRTRAVGPAPLVLAHRAGHALTAKGIGLVPCLAQGWDVAHGPLVAVADTLAHLIALAVATALLLQLGCRVVMTSRNIVGHVRPKGAATPLRPRWHRKLEPPGAHRIDWIDDILLDPATGHLHDQHGQKFARRSPKSSSAPTHPSHRSHSVTEHARWPACTKHQQQLRASAATRPCGGGTNERLASNLGESAHRRKVGGSMV
eukprot:2100351-Prymnesium_polylepis.1